MNVSFSFQLSSNVDQNEKINYLLRKTKKQNNNFDSFIEIQLIVNSNQNHQNRKFNHRIKSVKNNFIEFKQFNEINMNHFIVIIIVLQFVQQFTQQQKRLFSSHTLKLSIIQLNNSVERFKKFDIKYFDFTCSKSHDKNDYVIINDKIYYRNV